MKTGRRLLAMLLVLAMLLTNLPVGAIAAEVEDLPAEPTEALVETEQPTEASEAETEAPETTAAPTETEPTETTEAVTETAIEETTAPVVEPITAAAEAANETIYTYDELQTALSYAGAYRSEVILENDFTLGSGETLTVPDSAEFIIMATFTMADGAMLTIEDNGTAILRGDSAYLDVQSGAMVTVDYGGYLKIEAGKAAFAENTYDGATEEISAITLHKGAELTGITPDEYAILWYSWFSDTESLLSEIQYAEENGFYDMDLYVEDGCTEVVIDGYVVIPDNACVTFYSDVTDEETETVSVSITTGSTLIVDGELGYGPGYMIDIAEGAKLLYNIPDDIAEYVNGEVTVGGSCGENLIWVWDSEIPQLTISGTGAMRNWDVSPWTDYEDATVVVEEGVTSIGNYAFEGCYFTEISLPDSIITIGDFSYPIGDSQTEVILPENLISIGESAFSYTTLETISLPQTLTSIGADAFAGTALQEIVIPEGITIIADSLFSSCESLQSVTLPAGITSIGEFAFSQCSSLTEIVIPERVESIGYQAFSYTALESVVIPDSVVLIDDDAFGYCGMPESPMEITFEGDAPDFGEFAFEETDATVYYPADNDTWTEDVMQDYGGTITWEAYGEEGDEEENLPYLTYDTVWLTEIEDDFWAFGMPEEGPLVLPKGMTRYVLFYLNTLDEATGEYVSTPVHVTAGDYLEINTVDQDRIDDGGLWGDPAENGEYYCSITSTEWDKITEVSYTMEDGTVVRMEVDTSYQDVHFFSAPKMSRDNVIYYVDGNEMTEFYMGLTDSEATWEVEAYDSENYTFEQIDDSLYKVTLTENAREWNGRQINHTCWDEFYVPYTLTRGEETVTANAHMTFTFDYVMLRYVYDDGGLYEYEHLLLPNLDLLLRSGETMIAYLITWDFETNCRIWTPVAIEDLVYDSSVVTIAPVDQALVREDQANGDCFFTVTAGQTSGLETELSCARDDADGVNVSVFRPWLGFYTEADMTDEAYVTPYYENGYTTARYTVTADNEGTVYYLGWDNLAGAYDETYTITGVTVDAESQQYVTVTEYSENLYEVALTQEGREKALSGNPFMAVFTVSLDDGDWESSIALSVAADAEDVPPEGPGFFFRHLVHNGNNWYYEPQNGRETETNLYSGDVYGLYFFMRVWNEEQGDYEEIPVAPVFPSSMTADQIDGNAGWYEISVNSFGVDHVINNLYDGEIYSIRVTSDPHMVSVYATPEATPEGHIRGPVDMQPFGENTVYLVTNGDWEIENVTVHAWCAGYLDVESVSESIWSVTLTQDGINENLSQWWLDMGMDAELRNVSDTEWTESRYCSVTFTRENLEILGHFGIDDSSWFVIEDGYYREWFTEEYGTDDLGNTYEIWDAEVLADLPEGLTYKYDSNTLTMTDYSGERLTFFGEGVPTDTLTIELIGDNSLICEKPNPFSAELVNVVVQGDGSLTVEAINNFYEENGEARTFEAWYMRGGDLTVQDNASLIVEVNGQGNEAAWDDQGNYVGDETGKLRAMVMDGCGLYLKDNAYLKTVLPGLGRDGEEDVGEGHFPGGCEGITGVSHWNISGGTLVTQLIDLNSWYDDDGNFHADTYVQTGGDVTVQAQYWNSYTDEGALHAHYEGLAVRPGTSARISGGTLNINVEATDAQLESSTWYEAIGVRGGELTVSGDAVVELSANHGNGNLIGVYDDYDDWGNSYTGRLNIYGGTLNVAGTDGDGRHSICLQGETSFTMTGGTVNAQWGYITNHGPAHISGGTINVGGIYGTRGEEDWWFGGIHAGGPDFAIDGGEINVNGGPVTAGGMVTMNGGTITIENGSLQVLAGFAFNDGVITITNEAETQLWYGGNLWIENYLSIGGSDIENANPTLTIYNTTPTVSLIAETGCYHQGGGTVNITHGNTEVPAIYVASNLDDNGQPHIRLDGEGNPVLDENGDPVYDVGSFLMNDGILNVMNPGDYEADLINAMEADPHSNVQFRGGRTTFDTAQLNWNGETHITETAVVEVKDAVIIANVGHLVMDGGTLLANDESAVCLGMSEMNGGKMELENAMILVNGGFRFNNGEIIINNVSTEEATIDSEAIFTSLAANTDFAIGNPEDPDSNPKLTINHNLERAEALLVNGTMHLMAGSVDIHVPVTRAPAIMISGIQYDDEGNPLKTDRDGDPMGAEFLQTGGTLNIHATEEAGIAGIIGGEGSVFFMDGGEANLNGTNFVMSGNMALNDAAVLNISDGILRLYETASLDVNGGKLNMGCQISYSDDVFAVLQAEAGSGILLRGDGAIRVTSKVYNSAMQIGGSFLQSSGELTLDTAGIAMTVTGSYELSDGCVTINVDNRYDEATNADGETLTVRRAQGIYVNGWSNADAHVTISGGSVTVNTPEATENFDTEMINSLTALQASMDITGGVIHINGGRVLFNSGDTADQCNLGDMVVYSLDSGKRLLPMNYTVFFDADGNHTYDPDAASATRYAVSFEEDNVAGDLYTEEGVDYAEHMVIVTGKAGSNTTWQLGDGILTFLTTGNIGGMYDYSVSNPAPWYWLRDFVTGAEMDTTLGYIGSHAFNGMDKLTRLVFLGEAPNFAADAFKGLTADAYYPVETDSWTAEKMQQYGGSIAWLLNYQSVEVADILTDKDVLFSGEKATLTAQLYPELEEETDVVWTLGEGSEFAKLTVKNNVATVTANSITEKQTVTVYAVTEKGLEEPVAKVLTLYPKAQSVSIFRGDEDVTGAKIKADVEQELILTAALNPGDAEEYLSEAVTWTSSSAGIADVDENGAVTFKKTGTVKITATANDGSKKKAVVTVTVLDMIDEIVVDAESITEIVGGKSASFVAYDGEGNKLKTSQAEWSIPEEFAPYASITTAGKLTTKLVQEAVQVTLTVTSVDDPSVSTIHNLWICPAATAMQIDMFTDEGIWEEVTGLTVPVSTDGYDAENPVTVNLSAVASPDDALTSVTWKTSSKTVATVDEDGIVSGTGKAGTVTITATDANSKKTASVKLNFGVFAQEVTVTSTETEIVSGGQLTLTAETFPAEGLTKSGITWSLKNAADKAYLSVTAAGVVKAKTVYAPTDVVLVATSKDGQASAEMTLTILPKNMDMLVIKSGDEYLTNTTKTVNMTAGTALELSARTLSTELEEDVNWTSSAPKVATVAEDGTVTLLKTGTAKITATSKTDSTRKAVVTLKVVAQATGIVITEKTGLDTESLALAAGKTMTLVASGNDGSKVSVVWSVEPAAYATVSSGGKLTASANLTSAKVVSVTAAAKDGSVPSASVEVLLRPQIQGIQITGLSGITSASAELTNCTVVHDMEAEPVIRLAARTFPASASDAVTWTSSNAKVAEIDKETGEITCVKPGTVTVTATANDGSGKKATFKLTLVKLVDKLTLSQTEAVLAGGKSLTLKADVGDATDKTVTWSMSGDTAYVTLSAKGVLKASAVTAPKTVYVTATANDGSGKSATCTVTVYPATTAVQILYEGEVTTTKTVIEVQVGQTITLEGSSLPGNAAEVYTWKSSGTAATVVDGEVTGVTAGKTVTVTCTAADGTNKKTTVKVKVVEAE